MTRPSLVLRAAVVLLLLTGCGSTGGPAAGPGRQPVPGLAAPQGEGLVGPAPADIAAPAPLRPPAGAQVPTVGTCLDAVGERNQFLNDLGLGQVVDCGQVHDGVVVGLEGFDPAALQQGSSRYTTYEQLGSPADIGVVTGLAAEGCTAQYLALYDRALSIGAEIYREWSLSPSIRLPSYDQWRSGERWAACVLLAPDLEPVAGGVDVVGLTADQPLPPSLQACSTTAGDAIACRPGAAGQRFAEVPIGADVELSTFGQLTDDGRIQVEDLCSQVLGWLDSDLSLADWSTVSATQLRDDSQGGMGLSPTRAHCSLVNRNYGAGLESFLE